MISRTLLVTGVLLAGPAAWSAEVVPLPTQAKPAVVPSTIPAATSASQTGEPLRYSIFYAPLVADPSQTKAKIKTVANELVATNDHATAATSTLPGDDMLIVTLGLAPAAQETADLAGTSTNASNSWSRPWRLGLGYEHAVSVPVIDHAFVGVETGLVRMSGDETKTDPAFGNQYSYKYNMMVVPLTLHAGWRAKIGEHLVTEVGPFAGMGLVRSSVDSSMTTANSTYGSTDTVWGRYAEFGLRAAAWWRWESLAVGLDARWQWAQTATTYSISETRNGVVTSTSDITQSVSLNGLAIGLGMAMRL